MMPFPQMMCAPAARASTPDDSDRSSDSASGSQHADTATTSGKSNFHLGALDNSYLPHASSLASNILVLSFCALKPHKHGIGSN